MLQQGLLHGSVVAEELLGEAASTSWPGAGSAATPPEATVKIEGGIRRKNTKHAVTRDGEATAGPRPYRGATQDEYVMSAKKFRRRLQSIDLSPRPPNIFNLHDLPAPVMFIDNFRQVRREGLPRGSDNWRVSGGKKAAVVLGGDVRRRCGTFTWSLMEVHW